jgi:hypothetical protein
MSSTYEKIATTTLGSATATVTLSSIPATYTDLVLIINGTIVGADGGNLVRYNGDTGNNYSYTQMYGTGSATASNRDSNISNMQLGRQGSVQSTSIINVQNYSNTTTYKTAIARGSNTGGIVVAQVGLWRNTAAINSIAVSNESGNFNSGCTFTLYGIKAE